MKKWVLHTFIIEEGEDYNDYTPLDTEDEAKQLLEVVIHNTYNKANLNVRIERQKNLIRLFDTATNEIIARYEIFEEQED